MKEDPLGMNCINNNYPQNLLATSKGITLRAYGNDPEDLLGIQLLANGNYPEESTDSVGDKNHNNIGFTTTEYWVEDHKIHHQPE